MEKRADQRYTLSCPMKVFGMDSRGKPFIETARALNISPGGIHLAGLKAQNRVGEVIGIQYSGAKVRATVVWVGSPDSSLDGHIRVQVVGNDTAIWQAAQHLLQSFAPEKDSQVASGDRRSARRFACHGSVKLRLRGVGHPVWAAVSDVSLTGCYVETAAPAPPTTTLEMVLEVEGHTVHAIGEVRCSYPGVGMGILFTKVAESDRKQLETLLSKLSPLRGHAMSD
jgi:hypothetical protein